MGDAASVIVRFETLGVHVGLSAEKRVRGLICDNITGIKLLRLLCYNNEVNMLRFGIAFVFLATTAWADVPDVAVDSPAVHGLASKVMEGVGEPDMVLAAGASPHGYAMRPSEAGALAAAEVVFVVGDVLTPWLTDAAGKLASDARLVELIDVAGVERLGFREGAVFGAHDEDDHDHDH